MKSWGSTFKEIGKKVKKKHLVILVIVAVFLLIPLVLLISSPATRQSNRLQPEEEEIDPFSAQYVEDEMIVKFKDEYTLQELNTLKSTLEEIGVESQESVFNTEDPRLKNYFILKFRPGIDMKAAYERLSKLEEIDSVGLNYIVSLDAVPDDERYPQMWNLPNIEMPSAWDLGKGSNSVSVAVVDSGIDLNHEDFAGRNIKGIDLSDCDKYDSTNSTRCITPNTPGGEPQDDLGHGTHVSGTIGAMTNNRIGVAGVNWDVSLIAVKAIGKSGQSQASKIMEGIKYAVDNGADVINLSVAAPIPCSQIDGYQDSIDYAISRGVVVVASAGNDGKNSSGQSPASCSGVITVAASDQNNNRALFPSGRSSNYGDIVDVAAPGLDVLSTWINNGYRNNTGTSMASPHVAGVAALLLSVNPNLTVDQVKNCIVDNGDPLSADKPIGVHLNAFKTLNACSGLPPVSPQPTTGQAAPTQFISQPTQGATQYSITGVIYIDTNANGNKDSGEQGVTNAQIITEGQGSFSTSPDANGNFKFSNIPAGTYSVSAVIDGVKRATTPPGTLNSQVISLRVEFPFSPNAIAEPTTQTTPTTAVFAPTSIPKSTPKPTSAQTYTCREASNNQDAPLGTIKIGTLECVPN